MARLKYSDNQIGGSFDRNTYPPLEGAGGGNTTAFYTGFSCNSIHSSISRFTS